NSPKNSPHASPANSPERKPSPFTRSQQKSSQSGRSEQSPPQTSFVDKHQNLSSSNSPMMSNNKYPPLSVPPSPTVQESTDDSIKSLDDSDLKPRKKKAISKGTCPCTGSSSGKQWVLKCCECNQSWHASCANMKGTQNLTQTAINTILKHWQCPWCYVCPFTKPNTHSSLKNEQILRDKTSEGSNIQELTASITEVIKKTLPTSSIDLLTTRIDELSTDVKFLKEHRNPTKFTPDLAETPNYHNAEAVNVQCAEPPYEDYRENFLDQQKLATITEFLEDCRTKGKFTSENGHTVLSFGKKYHYTGSRSPSKDSPIPPQISAVIEDLVTELQLEHPPNSVLINYYPAAKLGDNCSFLSPHADDEPTILADSKIVTLSLGEARTIKYQYIHDTKHEDVLVSPVQNSVYTMTRSSQGWFKHEVLKPTVDVGERYSITFRCLSEKFQRSVLIIGDSNTKDIKFGS
ncbi:alpha-ketoglutarate-dependent dioxygenase AlkB, partial [Moritella sp.]|uniref:alpha-ketoglutarate-dependent dioxygenase AlkB n=1 Tax=Moritella sp. TaxID=78556 RepID=UPI0025CF1D5E